MEKFAKTPMSNPAGHGRKRGAKKGNRYSCGGKLKKSK
jgi:hypothetical protein